MLSIFDEGLRRGFEQERVNNLGNHGRLQVDSRVENRDNDTKFWDFLCC